MAGDAAPHRWRGWALALLLLVFGGSLGAVAIARWSRADPLARGRAAYERGRWEVAAGIARDRLKLDRDDRESIRLLARATAREGRAEPAMHLFNRLGAGSLQSEDLYLIGSCLTRGGRLAEATEVWKRALAADPDNPEVLESLARHYFLNVQPADAAALAEHLSRQPGWEAKADALLGPLLAELHDPEGAVRALRATIRREPMSAPAIHKLFARSLLQLHRPEEARKALGDVPGNPSDPEIEWLRSRAFLQEKNLPEASQALQQSGSYRGEHAFEAEPSPYVGEARCESCHRETYRAAMSARHARTFYRASQLGKLPLPKDPVPDPGDPKVVHAMRREGGTVLTETREGQRVLRLISEYAFGAEDRYLSIVGRDQAGGHRIFRLSYYNNGKESGWGLTSGQLAHPARPEQIQGKELDSPQADYRCLYCHTTTPRSVQTGRGPESADRAIGCERCHGPGSNHIEAVEARFGDLAIASPAHPSGDVTRMCAECHGLAQSDSKLPLPKTDPYWLRFQSTTMGWSRCYTESAGGLNCVTCHDPHRDVEKSAAFYESKCLECHAATTTKGTEQPTGKRCPVNPTRGCVECHMPKTYMPVYRFSVSDHYIRVFEKNSGAATGK